MENEIEHSYHTKDFYISVCILASGVTLIKLKKETNKTVSFIFAVSLSKAEEIIKKHWDRELILPTRDIVDAIHQLKTQIYSCL